MDLVAPDHLNPFTEQTATRYFVGRENQLRAFERSLAGLQAGRTGHMYVAGAHGTGKTSYLAKLVELARSADFLAAQPTLDPAASARQHVCSLLYSIIEAIDESIHVQGGGSERPYTKDWDLGPNSAHFRVARTDRLVSDEVRADLKTLHRIAKDSGYEKIVVCVDEGQRIGPFALSALKNALQQLDDYLLVLSLRLVDGDQDTVAAGRAILDEKANEAEGDIGASRMFVSGVPLGPFDSDQEARACLLKRLEGNQVTFQEEVISLIAQVTRRHPAAIISLAAATYDYAVETLNFQADPRVFQDAFAKRYRKQYEQSIALCALLTETTKKALSALVSLEDPVSPEELTKRAFPECPADLADTVQKAVTSELHALLAVAPTIVVERDGRYCIPNPADRYAMTSALGGR
ncbi:MULTISPECIES: ATP-binding protein [Micromonospora]|uniref:ATP-binding protein n=1 Tax=Micromonospora sp. BL1 TaxID=2478709 RepID=UPI00131555FB|nr:ATP-binding protein [Micromonospora sp. BL1]